MRNIRAILTEWKSGLIVLALVLASVTTFAVGSPVSATGSVQAGAEAARGEGQPGELFGDAGLLTKVTNLMLFVAGALAVIMIIFGGIRYAVSGGNSTAVTAAKNTILYAIVGLIVALLAFAAVNFVLGTLSPGSGAGYTDV